MKENRVLVVGASSGIGMHIAQAALRTGASVAFAARRANRLAEAMTEAPSAAAIVIDVADPGECERLGGRVKETLGGLDLIVYAAGVSPLVLSRDVTRDMWLRALEVNSIGPSLVAKACLPLLSSGGMFAYLSSDSVGLPRHGGMVYQASKAAAEEALSVLRTENPDLRFTNVIVGATVGTEIGRDRDPAVLATLAPEWIKRGLFRERFLNADRLGALIFSILAPAVEYREAHVTEIRIEAGGQLLTSLDQFPSPTGSS